MTPFYLIGLIITLCYIWFDTNAVVEYAKLFKLKFFKYEEFEEHNKKMSDPWSYHNWLLFFSDSWFVRLVACPICIIVWLAAIAAIIFKCLLAFGVITIGSWLGYFWLVKQIKKLNE